MSILLKDLNEKKLYKLTIGQIYNIMFGPLIDLKNRIEMEKPIKKESLIAVYGGRTDAILRRVNGLEKLSQYVDLSNGIILSGNSHWMKNERFKDEISEDNIKEKFKLLYKKYDITKEAFEDFIIRQSESDMMESKMQETSTLQDLTLYRDEHSKNSKENAEYTVEKFIDLRNENPELKRLVVISDWPYLLRQLLTTQKSMIDRGEDFEVTGYPSATNEHIGIDYDNLDNMIKGPDTRALLPNLRSIVNYAQKGDVDGEFDVEYYIKHKGLIDGGPSIYIGSKILSSNNEIFNKRIEDFFLENEKPEEGEKNNIATKKDNDGFVR